LLTYNIHKLDSASVLHYVLLMKILQLIYDDPINPWVGGGGAIRTKKINEFIVLKKHSITVLTGAFPGCQRQEIINGVKYIRIGCSKNYFLSRITYGILAGFMICKSDHDLLVEDFSGNSPTFAPLFTKKKSIAIVQNYFGPRILIKNPLLGLFSFIYEYIGLRLFSFYIPVSESLVKKIRNGKKLPLYKTIPQGIDKTYFKPGKKEERYLLFVGRLDFYQKGLDILLASLKENISLGIKLLIVGGGDYKKLKKMITNLGLTEYVEYFPHVNHDKMINIYDKSYFLCLPSRYEGWPLVCCESYARGKPVLGTDIIGLKNVLIHNKTGIKVKHDNVKDFSKGMRNLIINDSLRKKLSKNAISFSKNFLWDKMALKQLSFYVTVLNKEI